MDDTPVKREPTFFHPDLLEVPTDGSPPFLKGYRCRQCGHFDFPKVSPCPICWGEEFDVIPLSRRGVLYSATDVYIGQAGMKTPYTFGYVDLPENLRLLCQLDGPPGTFRCDDEVELTIGTIRMDGEGVAMTSYKFKKANT